MFLNPKHSPEFRKWQQKFYNSKEWKLLRDEVRNEKRMRCDDCHKLIKGKSICDHIEEITDENKWNSRITLNKDNLQLLCLECHNTKTFAEKTIFDVQERRDVNLF